MLQSSTRFLLPLAALALAAGCGGSDPVSYSAPVGINLKAKSGDVSQTVISEEKEITTESSNPYGKFIDDAHAQLGGNDPSRVEIEHLSLLLGADSTNVLSLDEVYVGDGDVALVMSDSNNTYDVGHVTDPTGTETDVSVVFDSASIAAQDWDRFLAGSFKVVIRGPAAESFSSKGAEADLQLTFTFGAYE
jgi:hypothetical protein